MRVALNPRADGSMSPEYTDTDDYKYLRLSVFFHALNGQQSEVVGIPFQSKGWHGSDGENPNVWIFSDILMQVC